MRTTKPTTLRTWSDHEGDPTAEGLEIAGIMVTYAELVEIDSRESALDRGVTPDLLEIWQNQGGRDYAQLVDWLYEYAEQQEDCESVPFAIDEGDDNFLADPYVTSLIQRVRAAIGQTAMSTDEALGNGWVFGFCTPGGTPISLTINRTE